MLNNRLFLATLAAGLLTPAAAFACGGFFCSAIQLVPVEQNAERILFEINGEDGTITTTVEIKYVGDPDSFSWVVPVPDTPELGIVPVDALRLLDTETQPVVVPPPTKCSGGGGGVNIARAGGGLAFDSAGEDDSGSVDVETLPQVGPFDPTVVSSDDPDALIEWLNDNDYLITPAMEPAVAQYVADGFKFLALKLAPDGGVGDIAPITMEYPGDEPMVPIVLTGVSAEPEMGIMAFIASDSRYESTNFTNFVVDTADVQAHPLTGQSNYYSLVSWRIDEAGGAAVATEFAGSLASVASQVNNNWSWNTDYSEAISWVEDVAQRQPYLTRMYARMSGWEMEFDPGFAETSGGDVSRTHDLSDRPAIETCGPAAQAFEPVPCGDTYCGVDAMCATTDVGDGCVCPAGTSARLIQEPVVGAAFLNPTVHCQDTEVEYFADVEGGGNACAGVDCGSGECAAVNGFPTCSCDSGFAATTTFDNLGNQALSCEKVNKEFGADQLLWTAGCGSCSAGSGSLEAGDSAGAMALLGLFGLGALGMRRRRA